MIALRQQFEDEAKCKFNKTELLFETSNNKYIEWLEQRLNTRVPEEIQIFHFEQLVQWGGLKYWVIEDNGNDQVLVSNNKNQQHPEYNDWWVNRNLLTIIVE